MTAKILQFGKWRHRFSDGVVVEGDGRDGEGQQVTLKVPAKLETETPVATTTESKIANGDLRQAKMGLCYDCHYIWWAPILKKCPRCTSENVVRVAEQPLDYKRV